MSKKMDSIFMLSTALVLCLIQKSHETSHDAAKIFNSAT